MHRRTLIALALLLLPTVAAPWAGPTAEAQTADSDLTIVDLVAENPVYDGKEPVTVIATVKNLGPSATNTPSNNQVHFRYNSTDQCLTGENDLNCDQPFNNTDPIPAGATVDVRVSWSPTEDQIGDGTLIATVESSSEPSGAQGNNRLEIPVTIAEYNATIDVHDNETRAAFPGQATPYRVNLTNVGNVPTTYALNISQPPDEDGVPQHLPEGWNATVHPVNVTVDPGQTRTVVALVTPPDDASEDDELDALFWATAQVPALHNFTTPLPTTTVTEELPSGYAKDVTLEVLSESSFVGPDPGNQTVAWRVTNNGTLPDAYVFEASASGDLADRIDLTAPPVTALNATNGTIVRTTVHVLEPIPVGQRGTVELAVASVNDDPALAPTSDLHQLVGSGPNLEVETIDPPEPAYASQGNVTVEVTVANTANLPSSPGNLTLTAERSGFAAVTAMVGVPAIPAATNATVPVSLPVAALAGSYVLVANVNDPATFNETNTSDNRATANLEVRTTGIEVLPADPLSLEPGAFARFVRPPNLFEIRNQGNAAEVVHVTVESQEGWIGDQTRTITVEPGTRAAVPIELRVPELPGVPHETITVQASLANVSAVSSSNQSRLVVVDEQPPELEEAQVPRSVEATVPTEIRATFRDAVGVAEAWMIVEPPEGGQERHPLAPGSNGTFTGNLTFETLGTANLTLHAADRSADNNTYHDPDPRTISMIFST